MTRPNRVTAEVLLSAEVPPAQDQVIIDAFNALDVAARVRIVPARRGSAEAQWLLLAVLPLQAFLSSLGSTFADEASRALKRLVSRVRRVQRESATRQPAPILVLQDAATRLQIVLEADLPADAYKALLSLDLSKFHKGPLHYDQHRGVWRSELDEQPTPQ